MKTKPENPKGKILMEITVSLSRERGTGPFKVKSFQTKFTVSGLSGNGNYSLKEHDFTGVLQVHCRKHRIPSADIGKIREPYTHRGADSICFKIFHWPEDENSAVQKIRAAFNKRTEELAKDAREMRSAWISRAGQEDEPANEEKGADGL